VIFIEDFPLTLHLHLQHNFMFILLLQQPCRGLSGKPNFVL